MRFKLREEPVQFESEGMRLQGMFGAPESPEPGGRGVVLIHGWGGYRIGPHRMLVHAAHALLDAGFATLRFDLRGRGDSEGSAAEADLDGMIEDALSGSDFLLGQAGVKRAALLGICSGSNVAIGAAALKRDIRELMLWSALPFQPEQHAHQRRRRAWHMLGKYARKAMQWRTWRRLLRGEVDMRMVGKAITGDKKPGEGERNLKDSTRNIMATFMGFTGRALFITGGKDPEGLEGRELFMPFCKANNINAAFHLVAGANHSYYSRAHAREVIDRTIAWLAKA